MDHSKESITLLSKILDKLDCIQTMQMDMNDIKTMLYTYLTVKSTTNEEESVQDNTSILIDMGQKFTTLADCILEDRKKQKVQELAYRFRRQHMKEWATTRNKRKTEAYNAIRKMDLAQIFHDFIEGEEVYIPRKFRQHVKSEASEAEIQRAEELEVIKMKFEIESYTESAAKHASKVDDLDKAIDDLISCFDTSPETEHLCLEVKQFLSKLWQEECVKEENTSKVIWDRKRQWFLNLPYNEDYNNGNHISPTSQPTVASTPLKKKQEKERKLSVNHEQSENPKNKQEDKNHAVDPVRQSIRFLLGVKEEGQKSSVKNKKKTKVIKSKPQTRSTDKGKTSPQQKMKSEIADFCKKMNFQEFKPTLGATMLMEKEDPFERPPDDFTEKAMEGAYLYLKKKQIRTPLNNAESLFFHAYVTYKILSPENGYGYDDATSAKLYVIYTHYIERDQETTDEDSEDQNYWRRGFPPSQPQECGENELVKTRNADIEYSLRPNGGIATERMPIKKWGQSIKS